MDGLVITAMNASARMGASATIALVAVPVPQAGRVDFAQTTLMSVPAPHVRTQLCVWMILMRSHVYACYPRLLRLLTLFGCSCSDEA